MFYARNFVLLNSGRSVKKLKRVLNFFGWMFAGPFIILFYGLLDYKNQFKALFDNMELQSTKDKLLERVTGDNKVFVKRYELLRNGVLQLQKVNPAKKEIPYLDLLNYMMQNGKI
jgi:hypothetical protein